MPDTNKTRVSTAYRPQADSRAHVRRMRQRRIGERKTPKFHRMMEID